VSLLRRRASLMPRSAAGNLVGLVSGAMCFLAICALAAGAGAGRVAGVWGAELEAAATVRVPAPHGYAAALPLAEAARDALAQAPGIAAARVIDATETEALAAPWLGAGMDAVSLPLPVLIDVTLGADPPDARAIQTRLDAAAPGAVYDDHTAWRTPLVAAVSAFRRLVTGSVALMTLALVAMVIVATRASVAGASATVRTLRLVGARDGFVARAFERPIAVRALIGGVIGAPLGALALAALPGAGIGAALGAGAGSTMPDLVPMLIAPVVCAGVALVTARVSVLTLLRREP